MIDKQELQELLVRLKLGTVSVENAIEDIEKNFYDEVFIQMENNIQDFQQFINCKDVSADRINGIIHGFLEKRASFLCYGIDEEKMTAIAKIYSDIEYFYNAGVIIKRYDMVIEKDIKSLLITSGDAYSRVCQETKVVLENCGIDCDISDMIDIKGLFSIKDNFKKVAVLIVISDDIGLASAVGGLFDGVVIWLPQSKDVFGTVSGGVCTVESGSGFAAAMAVLRLSNLS